MIGSHDITQIQMLNEPILAERLSEEVLETAEIRYWAKIMTLCPSNLLLNDSYFGCASKSIPVLAYNRVLTNDKTQLYSDEFYESVEDFYRKSAVSRWMLQIPEPFLDDSLLRILHKEGYRLHNSWLKLGSPLSEITAFPTEEAIIQEVSYESMAIQAGHLLIDAFEWPSELIIPLSGLYLLPGFKVYLLFHDEKAIAVGAIHFSGNIASLAIAGTDPNYRNKNAQKLLIHFRAQMARINNCQFLLSETGDHSPEKPNISFLNMRKMGLDVAYRRHNFVKQIE